MLDLLWLLQCLVCGLRPYFPSLLKFRLIVELVILICILHSLEWLITCYLVGWLLNSWYLPLTESESLMACCIRSSIQISAPSQSQMSRLESNTNATYISYCQLIVIYHNDNIACDLAQGEAHSGLRSLPIRPWSSAMIGVSPTSNSRGNYRTS